MVGRILRIELSSAEVKTCPSFGLNSDPTRVRPTRIVDNSDGVALRAVSNRGLAWLRPTSSPCRTVPW